MTAQTLSGNWNYPTQMIFGPGTISQLPEQCKKQGMTNPLLITDEGLKDNCILHNAADVCRNAGLETGVFSGVKGNPTGQNVEDGVKAYHEGGYDGVIAFGGGSGIDAAKAIALMVGQDRPLWDFEDVGDNWTRVNEAGIAPIVAVPTTAGTGSEVGRASVIIDTENHVKKIIFHPRMLPGLVILDPQLTVSLPPHITAATGMDALSHSLEALCSPFYHPMAEGIAVEAIRLVKEYLPRAVADGNDIEARAQMLVAASMGATAFQKGLGGMHAIAHSLGALYGAHHGLLNAILMPYVLNANQSVIGERIERLSRYLGLENCDFDGFLAWVLQMRLDLQIPHDLSAINIDDGQAMLVGEMAAVDPAAGGNPIPYDATRYTEIFTDAVNGIL